MDTIRTYLENMFAGYPQTQELKRIKQDLEQSMEDKYTELKASGKSENEAIGIVISEFGNIEELMAELGMGSSEKAGNGRSEEFNQEKSRAQNPNPVNSDRIITFDDAEDFLFATDRRNVKVAIGVAMCITAVAVFLNVGTWLPGRLEALALIPMLVLIGIAVGVFIMSGAAYERYQWLQTGLFQLEFGLAEELAARRQQILPRVNGGIAVGVILCILSPIGLLLTELVPNCPEWMEMAALSGLLLIVAFAVTLFIIFGGLKEKYDVLLQQGDFQPVKKQDREKSDDLTGKVAAVYWPIVTALYFLKSFSSGNWSETWTIWPVAGVLFAAVAGIIAIVKRDSRQA